MKASGIVRRIDDLGRVIIPREIQKRCGISAADATPLEIFYDEREQSITLKVYETDEMRRNKWVKEMLDLMERDRASRFIGVKAVNQMTIVTRGEKIEVSYPRGGDKFNKDVGVAVAYAKLIDRVIPDFV